ncbi:tetraacyldisaccharide 4'-kinase [Aquimarina sp. W85]|uniref:tetraacyldisaccharide 4'-kinase n=1 Tax=Aquimarina rhodophyticola TaxID=3342246 RepID=UPI00366D9575
MKILRKLLLPIVPIYYLITWLRNKLYDLNIKKSKAYDFPVLVVGNLSVGGTGKSPMIEYLLFLLKDVYDLAVLSRGYKRSTSGFQLVETSHSADQVGDEPLQFKRKFEEVLVAVDADRQNGIQKLRMQNPVPEVLLLDDAFQHRKVKAGFYILLTTFYDLYIDDIPLPTGNLREPREGAGRATIILVTKCPPDLSVKDQNQIIKRLKINANQKVYFTSIAYSNFLQNGQHTVSIKDLRTTNFTLITGIANPKPLTQFYKTLGLNFEHLSFPDHHNFTEAEITKFKKRGLLITTEKDFVRLKDRLDSDKLFYQPIEVSFLNRQTDFDRQIKEYIKNVI